MDGKDLKFFILDRLAATIVGALIGLGIGLAMLWWWEVGILPVGVCVLAGAVVGMLLGDRGLELLKDLFNRI